MTSRSDSSAVDPGSYAHTRDVGTEETHSEAVIEAVSSIDGEPPHALVPPLYASIDPEALDALFARPAGGTTPLSAEFTYRGYRVRVTEDEVVLQPVTA